jgi:hypothetical protein
MKKKPGMPGFFSTAFFVTSAVRDFCMAVMH